MQADGIQFAVETAASLNEPLPTPPQRLSDGAMRYWGSVVDSKRRAAWTDSDLLLACQLCRDYDAVDSMTADLEEQGDVLERASGMKYPNPLHNLIDKATRRILLATRALQVHSRATSGKTEGQVNKNETARNLKQTFSDNTLLFPTPQVVR